LSVTVGWFKFLGLPDSTEKCSVTFFLQCLDSRVGQCVSSLLEAVETGIEVDEGELKA